MITNINITWDDDHPVRAPSALIDADVVYVVENFKVDNEEVLNAFVPVKPVIIEFNAAMSESEMFADVEKYLE